MNRWPTTKQKEIVFRHLGYTPFPEQWPIHRSQATVLQIVGAEGGGKSQVAASEIAACVFPVYKAGQWFTWCKLVYLIGQTYENTHVEFNYLIEHLAKFDLLKKVSQPQQGSWEMELVSGCRIVTLSVERGATSIIAKGEQPDIFALLEAGIIGSESVLNSAIRRATRAKGRVILVGTLKDNFGWYALLVDQLTPKGNLWRGETYSLPAWINTYLYPGGRDDPEIKRLEGILPDEEFQRTVAAVKVPSKALIFPEFDPNKHVKPCPYDPELPVTIWIDPGYYPSVYAVIPVQFHGAEVWQIDEVYLNHHFHTQVIDVCKKREWWGNIKRAVIDFAGRQHHAEQSAEEVWQHYAEIKPTSQQVGVLDGISRHRSFLGPTPRLFHDPKCRYTIGEYGAYRRPTDKDGIATDDLPVDKSNHAMKAIAYGLIDKFGFVEKPRKKFVAVAGTMR